MRLPAPISRLIVRDLLGRPVLTQYPSGLDATLDLSALHPGSYLVQAEGVVGTATRSLVVE